MDREKKLELLQRSLALKHKLRVHDSMPQPDTHEDIAVNTIARWELEDELHAIEDILREARAENMSEKRDLIAKKGIVKKKSKK